MNQSIGLVGLALLGFFVKKEMWGHSLIFNRSSDNTMVGTYFDSIKYINHKLGSNP